MAELWSMVERAFSSHISGLLNKAAFEEIEKSLFAASPPPATIVAFTDLAGFKGVNDAYGHAAGDTLLKEVGRVLTNVCAKHGGTAFHLSGDEFALLFFEKDWSAARKSLVAESHHVEIKWLHEDRIAPINTDLFFGFSRSDPSHSLGTFLAHAEIAASHAKAGKTPILKWKSSMSREPLEDLRRRCDHCLATTRLLVPKNQIVQGAPKACANCGEAFK